LKSNLLYANFFALKKQLKDTAMKLEEHVKRTEELFGVPGKDIHQWLDGFFDTSSFERLLAGQSPAGYDPYSHRKFRHCIEGLEEAYEKFEGKYSREEIKNVFETHVKDDYRGYLPKREDFENGTFTEQYHDSAEAEDKKILSFQELTDYFQGKSYTYQKEKSEKFFDSFGSRIVLPTILAIILFISYIFFYVVPLFENNMLNQKKLMVKELTATAASVITHFQELEEKGELTPEEAKQRTIDAIKTMRYGSQNKNYFFIIDMTPKMILHPYRPELTGRDLSDYTDEENKSGKKLFVESVRIVKSNGEGYLRYHWQWKDDPSKTAEKLSYVKGIPQRGWIVGTGVYIHDIAEEKEALQLHIFQIVGVTVDGLFMLLAYFLLQSRRIENDRKKAEAGLKEVKDRYRALVESSNEGYLLSMDGRIVYSNFKLQQILGFSDTELHQTDIWNIIFPDVENNIRLREHLSNVFKNDAGAGEFDAVAADSVGNYIDVIVTTSRIFLSEKHGHVISLRPIVRRNNIGVETATNIPTDYKPIHSSLIKEIRESNRIGHVVQNMNKLPGIIRDMIDAGARSKALCMVIGTTYDEVIVRCIELSIDEIGQPPVAFAFLSLGSNARHEMTMFSDQDNAIIFEDTTHTASDKIRAYFLKLGDKVCSKLNASGYHFCPAGIMALHPKWSLSKKEWHKKLKHIMNEPTADGFLEFNVFFDLKCTYGNIDLANSIHSQIQVLMQQNPLFISYYAKNALTHKTPVNVFGRLKTERQDGTKTLNLKEALRPIEIFSRIYALKHGINAANTIKRLNEIRAKEEISKEFYKETVYIFNYLWRLRFFNQIFKHTGLDKVDDDLDIEELNNLEAEHLKEVISRISMLKRKISLDFIESVPTEKI
jgi:PAS domain S-box-containing protein